MKQTFSPSSPPSYTYVHTGTPLFTALCFMALHRCCMLYTLKIRPFTSKKITSHFIAVVWNQASNISEACLYIHIYTCVYIHTHTYAYSHTHSYMHTHTHIYIHIHKHTHTHTHINSNGCCREFRNVENNSCKSFTK